MKKKILGRTGLRVKTIGFGGIPIQKISEEEAVKVVRRCYEYGINYFDTARSYTVSEERIGRALNDVRDRVFIATKSNRRTKHEVLEDLEISLRDLRTKWIDVYQLHGVSSSEEWEQISAKGGALEALYEAQDEGKIHHLGITSHNPLLLMEIMRKNIFETVMIPFNYLTTSRVGELLSKCREMNVGTVIMKPIGGGAFSNAKVALKFVLENINVDIVIPGMMSLSEVEENIAISSGSYTLSAEELEIIEKDRVELGSEFCRACDYCKPCPQNIDISFVLRAETFLKRIGWIPKFDQQFQDAKNRVASCIHCGECESKCPYHLPIMELLPAKIASVERRLEKGDF